MASFLRDVFAGGDQTNAVPLCIQYTHEFIQSKNWTSLKELLVAALSEGAPPAVGRACVETLQGRLNELSTELLKEVFSTIIDSIQHVGEKSTFLGELLIPLSDSVVEYFEKKQDWETGAEVLKSLSFGDLPGLTSTSSSEVVDRMNVEDADGTGRSEPATTRIVYQLNIYVRLSEMYIKAGDLTKARHAVSTSARWLSKSVPVELCNKHESILASIQDHAGNFLEAANRYWRLSIAAADTHQQLEWLRHAVVDAILAGAGPQRSQLLNSLHKDHRCCNLNVFPALESVRLGRILKGGDVDMVKKYLEPHHLKPRSEDVEDTVLRNAVIEHNIAAISQLYVNIRFSELSTILGLPEDTAQKRVANMISESRLAGVIDQCENAVLFSSKSPMEKWDDSIELSCSKLNDIADELSTKFPQLLE